MATRPRLKTRQTKLHWYFDPCPIEIQIPATFIPSDLALLTIAWSR